MGPNPRRGAVLPEPWPLTTGFCKYQVAGYLLTNSGLWRTSHFNFICRSYLNYPEYPEILSGLTKSSGREKSNLPRFETRDCITRREPSNCGGRKWDASGSQHFTGGTEPLKLNGLPKITARERLQRTSKPRCPNPQSGLFTQALRWGFLLPEHPMDKMSRKPVNTTGH